MFASRFLRPTGSGDTGWKPMLRLMGFVGISVTLAQHQGLSAKVPGSVRGSGFRMFSNMFGNMCRRGGVWRILYMHKTDKDMHGEIHENNA